MSRRDGASSRRRSDSLRSALDPRDVRHDRRSNGERHRRRGDVPARCQVVDAVRRAPRLPRPSGRHCGPPPFACSVTRARRTVVLVGDSHAAQLLRGLLLRFAGVGDVRRRGEGPDQRRDSRSWALGQRPRSPQAARVRRRGDLRHRSLKVSISRPYPIPSERVAVIWSTKIAPHQPVAEGWCVSDAAHDWRAVGRIRIVRRRALDGGALRSTGVSSIPGPGVVEPSAVSVAGGCGPVGRLGGFVFGHEGLGELSGARP